MKVNWKAVFLGFLAEFGCWCVALIPLLSVAVLDAAEIVKVWNSDVAYNDFMSSFSVATISFIVGLLGSFLGGWTCASIARRDETKHALYAAGLSLIMFSMLWVVVPLEEPLKNYEVVYTIAGFVLIIPCYIFGAKGRAHRGYVTKTELPSNQPPIPEP